MMTKNNIDTGLGIYVHIPFCISKCIYCGFYSRAGAPDAEEENTYVNLLVQEIENAARPDREVDSIFFGGGTPSILKAESLIEILSTIRRCFDVSAGCEITLEANPGTLNKGYLSKLYEAGFNRLSMGCQSFSDEVLKTLGRIHRSKDVYESFSAARVAGFDNINLDLMFSVPGADEELWQETLDKMMELSPEHVSFYSLQIEEDTPLYNMYKNGIFAEVSDELDRSMYHRAIECLKSSGYEHYEISNAAKPGFECRHNLKYWSLSEYLGFGKSASSFIDGVRFTNATDDGYGKGVLMESAFLKSRGVLSMPELGNLEFAKYKYSEFHVNDFMDTASEFVFLGLRRTAGISFDNFEQRFGKSFVDVYADRRVEIEPFIESGDLVEDESGLRLSERGFDISNKIMAIFV